MWMRVLNLTEGVVASATGFAVDSVLGLAAITLDARYLGVALFGILVWSPFILPVLIGRRP